MKKALLSITYSEGKSKKRELPPRTMVLLLLPQAQMEKTWTKMALHSSVAQMLVSVVCVCLVQD